MKIEFKMSFIFVIRLKKTQGSKEIFVRDQIFSSQNPIHGFHMKKRNLNTRLTIIINY